MVDVYRREDAMHAVADNNYRIGVEWDLVERMGSGIGHGNGFRGFRGWALSLPTDVSRIISKFYPTPTVLTILTAAASNVQHCGTDGGSAAEISKHNLPVST
mmetsp:Transcript_40406/g.84537  ORF Transcript_40406/g.84537 Transcript_40406/m.84537 type:complete len:102 (-) Transcript_40406:449-754(-)